MSWFQQVFIANFAATFFLAGLIWMVQVVHYPLFNDVGKENYIRYHQRHQNNISLIVGPVMLIELATAILLIWAIDERIDRTLVYVGLGLVLLIWLSTALIQVPCHEKLARGFDPVAYRWLVNSNWIRTIAWTARGWIVVAMLFGLLTKVETQMVSQ
ncbi:MAG: hypothetical protein JNL67_14635 [Planctomycetaceae bacterium]|nr:hypothetical protein [Planctomycetaceae bacterium]